MRRFVPVSKREVDLRRRGVEDGSMPAVDGLRGAFGELSACLVAVAASGCEQRV
jgi:hypothetical protein